MKNPGCSSSRGSPLHTSGNSSYQNAILHRPPAAMRFKPKPPAAMILSSFQTGICSNFYVSRCASTASASDRRQQPRRYRRGTGSRTGEGGGRRLFSRFSLPRCLCTIRPTQTPLALLSPPPITFIGPLSACRPSLSMEGRNEKKSWKFRAIFRNCQHRLADLCFGFAGKRQGVQTA